MWLLRVSSSREIGTPSGSPSSASFETYKIGAPELSEGDSVQVIVNPDTGSRETEALRVKAILFGTFTVGVVAYANADDVVDTDDLQDAIDDRRGGDVGTESLRDVTDYWRSGDSFE